LQYGVSQSHGTWHNALQTEFGTMEPITFPDELNPPKIRSANADRVIGVDVSAGFGSFDLRGPTPRYRSSKPIVGKI
jgi:hypothetical protein